MALGANIGADAAIFEAVHGSALDIAHLGVFCGLTVVSAGPFLKNRNARLHKSVEPGRLKKLQFAGVLLQQDYLDGMDACNSNN